MKTGEHFIFYLSDEDFVEAEKNTKWSTGLRCRKVFPSPARTHSRTGLQLDYPSDWFENVPSAIKGLADLFNENQKRELRIDLLEIVINDLKSTVQKLQDQRSVIAPINTFTPEPYKLKKCFFASVQPTASGFLAGWFDANIYSAGETEEEAIQNLKAQILDFFDSLSEEPLGKLGPEPRRQILILKEFIEKS